MSTPTTWQEQSFAHWQLMRFDKPIGTLLLLWPTWSALWLANTGTPPLSLFIIFSLGVIVMRAAGCVVNDIADRDLDMWVERTKQRPLTRGVLTLQQAVLNLAALLIVALILVLQLNWLTIALSLIGLVLAMVYPLMKRVTHWPQVVLALAFNWGIILAFCASTNSVPAQAWLLYTIGCLWTVAYDTIYAMVDKEDDLKIGIKSTAIILGELVVPFILVLFVMMLIGLIFLGQRMQFGWIFYLGLIAISGMIFYQWQLIREANTTSCFRAFLHNQWLGLILFISVLLAVSF